MHEALMASCANVVGEAFTEGTQPDVKQQRTTGGSAFYRTYDTADGRQLVLAGQEMKFIKNLLGALGKPEMAPLCEWPGAHQKPVVDFLAATFRANPLAHWMEWLDTLDICYGPVNTLPEAIADPNLVKRGAVVTGSDGRKHFAPVVRFRDEPSRPLYREPLLGRAYRGSSGASRRAPERGQVTDRRGPWGIVSRRDEYDNRWIRVTHHEVMTPAGAAGIYGTVHFKNKALGIVPVDAEEHTFLVGQYRFALDAYSWEIPEGGGALGDDFLESAQRELREETGLRAARWQKLVESDLSNSVSDESAIAFLAWQLEQGESAPDSTEELVVRRLPLVEAFRMVELGGDPGRHKRDGPPGSGTARAQGSPEFRAEDLIVWLRWGRAPPVARHGLPDREPPARS